MSISRRAQHLAIDGPHDRIHLIDAYPVDKGEFFKQRLDCRLAGDLTGDVAAHAISDRQDASQPGWRLWRDESDMGVLVIGPYLADVGCGTNIESYDTSPEQP
jgi:hypothetical protein